MRTRLDCWLANAARATGVQLVDCGPDRGHSLLIASGSGLMMAVLDQVPDFRWCVELDRGGKGLDFALLAHRHMRFIGLCGWFSLHSPATFEAIQRAQLSCPVLAYGGNIDLGCSTLPEFIWRCQLAEAACPLPTAEPPRELVWTRVGAE